MISHYLIVCVALKRNVPFSSRLICYIYSSERRSFFRNRLFTIGVQVLCKVDLNTKIVFIVHIVSRTFTYCLDKKTEIIYLTRFFPIPFYFNFVSYRNYQNIFESVIEMRSHFCVKKKKISLTIWLGQTVTLQRTK